MSSYILFYSSNYVIWAKKELTDKGIRCKIAAVPREISSDCGYCIEIFSKDKEKALEFLKIANLPLDKIVDL